MLEDLVCDSDFQLTVLSASSRHNVEAVFVVEEKPVCWVHLTEDMLAIETDYELLSDFTVLFEQKLLLPVDI